MNSQQIKACVKGEYGQAALQTKRGGSSCCGMGSKNLDPITFHLYEEQETESLPEEPCWRH